MGWQNIWSTERSIGVVVKWTIRMGIIGLIGTLAAQLAGDPPIDAMAVLATGFDGVGLGSNTVILWPNGLDWKGGWAGVVRTDRAISLLPPAVIMGAKQVWWLSFAGGVLLATITMGWLMRSPDMKEEDPDHRRGSVSSGQAELVKKLLKEVD